MVYSKKNTNRKKSYRKKSNGGKRLRRRRTSTKKGGKYHFPLNYFNNRYHKYDTGHRSRRTVSNKLINNILKSMRYKPKRSCRRH